MYLVINLKSSNLASTNNFNRILSDKITELNNIKIFKSCILKRKSKKKFTVLKSPHVNKDSREQFEIRNYKRTVKIYSYQPLLLIFLIKFIKNKLNSDVEVKINFEYNVNQFSKHLKSNLNLNNSFNNESHYLNNNSHFVKNCLKSLDSFGELILKQ